MENQNYEVRETQPSELDNKDFREWHKWAMAKEVRRKQIERNRRTK